jgi:iron-sulfur cluster repair protein YtfE (RIC family)
MKPTTLLKKQHRHVEAIFKQLEAKPASSRHLLDELANNLTAHMGIEQDIYYPAVRAIDETLINEAYEEHAVAELEMKRLLAADRNDPMFLAKLVTLKELIAHHVKEEEGELFPQVDKAMDSKTLDDLGSRMEETFATLLAAGHEELLSKNLSQTTSDRAQRKSKTVRSEA